MIKEYRKDALVQNFSQNCSLFKVVQEQKCYFMYEYSELNECDQYNFKVIKKLVSCVNVLGLVQKFIEGGKTYFITDYVPSNLLKQQSKQPDKVYQIPKAFQIFTKIVQIIEQIHQNSIIYRNLKLETIGVRNNELFLSDFRFCQMVKRKEKYFEVVGDPNYLAPQFYSKEGYGFEVDVWAAGVCLYHMLTGSFPFDCKDKNREKILQQIQKKCKGGFSFQANSGHSMRQKGAKYLQDLFRRIFLIDATQRITVAQLRKYHALGQFVGIQSLNGDFQALSIIHEQGSSINESIFVSMLNKFPCHYEFHKEEIILDFMERSSEVFMLNSQSNISQELRKLVNFSILKVALLKATNFIDVLYGIKKPLFKIELQQWQRIKVTPAFTKVKQKIEKKKKILQMLFKSACLNVKDLKQKSSFYSDEIPLDFQTVKQQLFGQSSEYRKNLSKMFELEKQITKRKQDKGKFRKGCQNLVRLTILCLINRIFEEDKVKQNFQLYFNWSKKQSLQSLEEWIQKDKSSNLKNFIVQITKTYME